MARGHLLQGRETAAGHGEAREQRPTDEREAKDGGGAEQPFPWGIPSPGQIIGLPP